MNWAITVSRGEDGDIGRPRLSHTISNTIANRVSDYDDDGDQAHIIVRIQLNDINRWLTAPVVVAISRPATIDDTYHCISNRSNGLTNNA